MPVATRDAFVARIANLLRDYEELLLAVHGKKRQPSLEIMLSEQAAMSLGVYWEAFVHDLFVAYVARNPVNCIADLKRRLDKSLAEKFNLPQGWFKVSIPSGLNARHAERMIDPKGWNVHATSAEELRSKANQFLHSTDARNFALDQDDASFVDLMVAIRNYLAHRSTNGRSILKSRVAGVAPTGRNSALVGPFTNSGSYLKSRVSTGRRRIHAVGDRLIEVARKLVP